ncbi:hypothetical protein J1N35_028217 [Gossypium stocksii]|uniref:Uncharacterized protein n=1 Tax=Gossypium stocksii TaxID=47602 RepID=A0A9D3UVY5_9ROSI|nr:hypothetical protein J1N35_028217 [Gossypium stocksii]
MLSMATCSSRWVLKQSLIVGFLFVIIISSIQPVNGCFTSIFSFGDSLTDTGNLLEISLLESNKLPPSAFPPNGRTFFHHPSGRRCDGRLVIDFLAEALGIPFLQPSYTTKVGRLQKFQKGMNFAVAGATALNSSFLQENGIYNRSTNISLGDELNSFKHLLPSLCSSSADCKKLLRNSLIVMGVIGGNDYNHAFREKNNEAARKFVPLDVQTIASAIHFSQHHNEFLRSELEKLRNHHPDINIVYADYYNTVMRFYHSPKQFGFKETLKACCGIGGLYNYNTSRSCGYPPLKSSCTDPSSYISWDGIHYTEAANKWLANVVFEDLMKSINCVPH